MPLPQIRMTTPLQTAAAEPLPPQDRSRKVRRTPQPTAARNPAPVRTSAANRTAGGTNLGTSDTTSRCGVRCRRVASADGTRITVNAVAGAGLLLLGVIVITIVAADTELRVNSGFTFPPLTFAQAEQAWKPSARRQTLTRSSEPCRRYGSDRIFGERLCASLRKDGTWPGEPCRIAAATGALSFALFGVASPAQASGIDEPGGARQLDGDNTDAIRDAVEDSGAKNVILLIGDGMGQSEITAARNYAKGAHGRFDGLDALPMTGQYTTYAVDKDTGKPDYVTDSAASATGWSSGTKTYKRGARYRPQGQPAQDPHRNGPCEGNEDRRRLDLGDPGREHRPRS